MRQPASLQQGNLIGSPLASQLLDDSCRRVRGLRKVGNGGVD